MGLLGSVEVLKKINDEIKEMPVKLKEQLDKDDEAKKKETKKTNE